MADRFKPNHADVLERIEHALRRVADALEQRPSGSFRWYEASWNEPYDGRRVTRAIEAETAADAREQAIQEAGNPPHQPSSFRLAPLRNEQCKHCCAAEWATDGTRCEQCGYSDEDGTRRRREGRSYDQ